MIVRHLVDHAVLPALEDHLARVAETARTNAKKAADLLFDFRVLDPAMGSAHFLADAVDRIAERIGTFLAEHPLKPVTALMEELRAEARWGGRIEDGDLLRRLVVKRCIYGIDLSGMAVEVAKVTLWLASFVPGISLAYLGHNLRRGDALVGVASEETLADDLGPYLGAYEGAPIPRALARAREAAARIAETPDRTPDEVAASRKAQQELDEVVIGLDHVFDVWTAEPFGLEGARSWLIGGDNVELIVGGQDPPGGDRFLRAALRNAEERSVFHWLTEFPEVFGRETPGFDVVIGNPPWDEINVEELGFFALHDPGLRGLRSESERKRRIGSLRRRFPDVAGDFDRRREILRSQRHFYGPAGGYVRQGAGNLDLYELFTERYASLARQSGWLGVVLPRTAFLGVGSQGFRAWLFADAEIRRLDFILNNRSWAFPIHPQYTIALVAARREAPAPNTVIRIAGPSSSPQAF